MRRLRALIVIAAACWLADAAPAWANSVPHRRSDALTLAPPGRVALEVDVPRLADSPAVREAVFELSQGRPGAAASALQAARDGLDPWLQPYVDYLRARSDQMRGRLAEAEAAFAKLETALPFLADHLRARRAQILMRTNRAAEAEPLVLGLPPTEPAFDELHFGLVERWLASGRAAEVPAVLDRLEPGLTATWKKARAARLRADALLAVEQDRKAWRGRLADLWRTWPRTRAARDAEPMLLAAFADPATDSPLTAEEVLDIAIARARSGKADAFADAFARRFGGQARGLDVLLRAERTFPKGLDRLLADLDRALTSMPLPAIEERMLDLKARVLRRLDRGPDALAVYRQLGIEARVPAHRAAALLEGGALARRLYDHESARWFFEGFLAHHADVHEGGAHRPLALWNLAWIAWRQNAPEVADLYLGKLIDEHPTALDDSRRTYYERALYWRARCQQKTGRISAARATWRFLAERFPLSYYASLSQGWLWRTGAGDASLPEPPPVAAAGARHEPDLGAIEPEAAAAAMLYRLGLEDEARRALRHLHGLEVLGPHGQALLSSLYRPGDEDDWQSGWQAWGQRALETRPEGPHRDRWLAAFPRPFDAEVLAEADEHSIPAALIWSVMRQESGFRANVRSHAKAHGLMQVLYPTAKLVAKRLLGEKQVPSLKQVYSVRGNIHYGTGYLRHLLDKFDGHVALAVAGYNAGPGAVDRWLRRVGQLDADEFVEEIPYDETRGYVRRVLHNLAAYRHLYGETDAPDPRRMPMLLPGKGQREPVSLLLLD